MPKSSRTSKTRNLITWGKSYAIVEGIIKNTHHTTTLKILISPKGKELFVNNKKDSTQHFLQKFYTISFSAEEIDSLSHNPHQRRSYLDSFLAKLHFEHLTQAYYLTIHCLDLSLRIVFCTVSYKMINFTSSRSSI